MDPAGSLVLGAIPHRGGRLDFTIIWATATVPRGLAFAAAIVLLAFHPWVSQR